MKMNDLHFLRIFEWRKIPKILLIATAMFLSPQLLWGQQKTFTIKGTVKDDAGGLPGASILIEGTSTGTITDQNGNYELTITTDQNSVKVGT